MIQVFTCTPKIPNTMKKAQQMRTMFPMGLKDVIRVSTTSFRPGARLITLPNAKSRSRRANTAHYHNPVEGEKSLAPLPERSQSSEQAEDAEDPEDSITACGRHGDQDVHQRHKHQQAVQDVPAAVQIHTVSKV